MSVPERNLPAASQISFQQMQALAKYACDSRMFGVQNESQAMSLMMLAQSEGIHPMRAVMEYHVIQGKPSLKADMMLARFQQDNGKVDWHCLTDQKVEATFSHPAGGSARIEWDWERAKRAKLADKDNWKAFPRAMLRSRVISEGVRTVRPGVLYGLYTPEEVVSLDPDLPTTTTQAVNMAGTSMLQSIVDEWIQQITESADEASLRAILQGAVKEARSAKDAERIGLFTLAFDEQLQVIRASAEERKAQAYKDEERKAQDSGTAPSAEAEGEQE